MSTGSGRCTVITPPGLPPTLSCPSSVYVFNFPLLSPSPPSTGLNVFRVKWSQRENRKIPTRRCFCRSSVSCDILGHIFLSVFQPSSVKEHTPCSVCPWLIIHLSVCLSVSDVGDLSSDETVCCFISSCATRETISCWTLLEKYYVKAKRNSC